MGKSMKGVFWVKKFKTSVQIGRKGTEVTGKWAATALPTAAWFNTNKHKH